MARSKKPTSETKGNKSAAQPSKADASKPGTAAVATPKKTDTPAPSSASQAAAAKKDTKTNSAPKTDTAAKDVKAPASATKSADAKPDSPKPTDAKPPAQAKPTESNVKAAAAKTEVKVSSHTPAKPVDAKPATKTAEAKPVETAQSKPVETKKPEPKPAETKKADTLPPVNPTAPAKQPEKQGGVFLPLVFGGLIAGGLGFAASEYDFLKMRGNTDEIEATLAKQEAQIAELKPADLSGLESGLAEVSSTIDDLSETVTSLGERVTALESRPVIVATDENGPPPEYAQQLAAYQQELQTLKTAVEGQNDEVARLLENAQSVKEATAQAAREAAIQAASAKLVAAIGSGAPFAPVIEDLTAAGITDLPPELTDPAADGVATISSLQSGFPAVARSALGAARTAGVDAGEGGVGGFLRRQLGARSVAPREGDDPDAVLSRAEAAVRSGSVGAALSELDALPPEVQGAMEDWLSQARTRAGAEQAVQDLSERLTAN